MSPDVAASVGARLLKQAKHRGEEFERTLARFAGERLLFRLGASAARDRCILKRGAAPQDFDLIGTEFHRWVRDHEDRVDLAGSAEFRSSCSPSSVGARPSGAAPGGRLASPREVAESPWAMT